MANRPIVKVDTIELIKGTDSSRLRSRHGMVQLELGPTKTGGATATNATFDVYIDPEKATKLPLVAE